MVLTATLSETPDPAKAGRFLARAGALWLGVAIAGQLIFAAYIAAIYAGGTAGWNRSPAEGYEAGDVIGNLMFGLHVLFAFIIILGGAAQLVPALRRRMPAFHRWTGRAYMLSATILALGGIGLVAWRGAVGNAVMHAGTLSNAGAILLCAGFAWTHARGRRFDLHRRWALRLFLCVSGVWFFRVGLMLWLLVFKAPVGFDPRSFTGPFLEFLSFAQYLLPLAVLELYFQARDRGGAVARHAVAGLLCVLSLATAGGIFGATMGMWLPRI
ncbi:DUF2306 domain-containing protein [Niveispirillum sp. KHB5.9]|uniref:DUF2306 domain-containing protein n=1 Tax=Niveispirillum sp. KHB5.9 TaxID=3400269 RepID=UPI003A882F11